MGTTPSRRPDLNELVATIHDRMPVILTEYGERLWIDADTQTEEALSVLTSYPGDLMEAFAVSTTVNRPGGERPECWSRSRTDN